MSLATLDIFISVSFRYILVQESLMPEQQIRWSHIVYVESIVITEILLSVVSLVFSLGKWISLTVKDFEITFPEFKLWFQYLLTIWPWSHFLTLVSSSVCCKCYSFIFSCCLDIPTNKLWAPDQVIRYTSMISLAPAINSPCWHPLTVTYDIQMHQLDSPRAFCSRVPP